MPEAPPQRWRLSPGLRWRTWGPETAVAFVPSSANTLLLDGAACTLLGSADADGRVPTSALLAAGLPLVQSLEQAGLLVTA